MDRERFVDKLGRRLSLVLFDEDDEGKPDVWIHAGTLFETDSGYVLGRGDGPPIELRSEWMARIEVVPEHLRDTMLGADWFIRLNVERLPENADLSEYVPSAIPNHRKLLDAQKMADEDLGS